MAVSTCHVEDGVAVLVLGVREGAWAIIGDKSLYIFEVAISAGEKKFFLVFL